MNWGPSAWKFLHSVTFNFPDNPTPLEQQEAEKFFSSLKNLLPCEECKRNYETELQRFPIDTRSKYALSNWLVNVHNAVNIRLGKSTLNYAEATKIYENNCAQCNNKYYEKKPKAWTTTQKGIVVAMVLSLIFVIVIAVLYRIRIQLS